MLCAQCEAGYSRNSSFQCTKCPPIWQNALILSSLLILFIAGAAILVRVTLASLNSEKSVVSIYCKTLMNHLHLLMLVASFDLDWPAQVKRFFESSRSVADAPSQIFSVDCFLQSAGGTARFFLQLGLYVALPLLVAGVAWLWWLCTKPRCKRKPDRTVAAVVVLLFLLHPLITTVVFQAFFCTQIDGNPRLVQQLEQVCWQGAHLLWATCLGGAGLLLWVIGVPLFTGLTLREESSRLQTLRNRVRYGFLYKGYRESAYFWEVVVMARKVLLAFISVFLQSAGIMVQALLVQALVVLFILLTSKVRPFTSPGLNFLEILSLAVLSLTVYAGLFFLAEEDASSPAFHYRKDFTLSPASKWLLFLLILVSNLFFFIVWLHSLIGALAATLVRQCPALFRCCCLCNSRARLRKIRRHLVVR